MDNANKEISADADGRLPYEPPDVVEEAEFETLALACTQSNPETQPTCYVGATSGS